MIDNVIFVCTPFKNNISDIFYFLNSIQFLAKYSKYSKNKPGFNSSIYDLKFYIYIKKALLILKLAKLLHADT